MQRLFTLLLTIFLLTLTNTVAVAQNHVRLIRGVFSSKTFKPVIRRTITTRISRYWEADAAATSQVYTSYRLQDTSGRVVIQTERVLAKRVLKAPTILQGPYNYLKVYPHAAKIDGIVDDAYKQAWKDIQAVQGYNGAHHIVNKYTIKRIHADLKARGHKVSLTDMQNNAPAIFHPFHGKPEYKDVFHDAEQQYHDYKLYGMEVVVMSKLAAIDELNRSVGLTPLSEEYIENVLKEAKFWCKHYGMNWDSGSSPLPVFSEDNFVR